MFLFEKLKMGLEEFLSDREGRFPNVSERQKEDWIYNCYTQIMSTLEDVNFYYDNVPNDVEEK